MLSKLSFLCVPAVALASAAQAQTGAWNPSYGTPVSIQTVNTGFGNSTTGNSQVANGSELDAAYSYLSGNTLNLLITGNLESSFNKLVLFIDNGSGSGQNVISGGANLPGQYTGFTFDTGFSASHYIIANGGGSPYGYYVDAGDLISNQGGYVGGNNGQGALSGGSYASGLVAAAINNSNVAGVNGEPSATLADPMTAQFGMEFAINLSWLNLAAGTTSIRITAFINGAGHDYASNQFLGGLPAFTGNLGGNGSGTYTGNLSGINLNNFAGDQFFTVTVPAPGAVALLALAGVAGISRRRRA
jgi:hypothetical protein